MAWVPQGARPGTDGQSEGVSDREVVGAVNAIATHPDDPDILYIGAVNGGVWRTGNALANRPDWVSLMPDLASLSIGALSLDLTDPNRQTIVAGSGRFSSYYRAGGALLGVLRSTDDGASWTAMDNGGLFGALHIRAIHCHGSTIVLAGNATQPSNADGIYHSDDGGQSFVHQSPLQLRQGRSLALVASPVTPTLLYAHAGNAIFRSTDCGGTWVQVSDASMESMLFDPSNVRIAAGPGDSVFVAIARNGKLSALFHSQDGGSSWAALDLPISIEGQGAVFGLHPGRQADIHFSMAADLQNANIVYLGGDRQPAFNEGATQGSGLPQFPNSIGATTYSGRLFRLDANLPPGSQVSAITHNGTMSGSAPHADSRVLMIAANGELIEGDDGGVYGRSDPHSNSGDWRSLIGSLQNTEFHSGAWDPIAGVAMGGAQDNGTLRQAASGDSRWPTVMGGDGGVVAIAPVPGGNGTVRYSSYQNLGAALRMRFSAAGTMTSWQYLQLQEIGTTKQLSPQFYTPIQVNRAAPLRLLLCGKNGVWESLDRGDTIRPVDPGGIRANSAAAVAYGADNDPEIIYVGARQHVYVRTAAHPAPLVQTTAFSNGEWINAIALNPANSDIAYAASWDRVWETTDAGQSWVEVTADFHTAGGRNIRSLIWCNNGGAGQLVAGCNSGVFVSAGQPGSTWARLSTGLPAVPVMQLQYVEASNVLLAATLGRGAWTLSLL